MRKKIPFIFLFLLAFSFIGTLGFFDIKNNAYAQSTTASKWDGSYATTESELSDIAVGLTTDDWYVDEVGSFYIRSAKGFSYFASLINVSVGGGYSHYSGKKIYLETDVDLDGHDFVPIGEGSTTTYFGGEFYGQKHYIYNLKLASKVTKGATTYTNANLGLFGYLASTATVSNLHIRNFVASVDTSVTTDFGAIAGYSAGRITQCSVDGKINIVNSANAYGRTAHIGGVVGTYYTSRSTALTNSYSKVDMVDAQTSEGSMLYLGGLVGLTNTKVQQCYSDFEITAQGGHVGGLVGVISQINSDNIAKEISNSYSVGNINITNGSNLRAGGLVGMVDSNTFTLDKTYFYGDIVFDQNTIDNNSSKRGGLVGDINNTVANNAITLRNSFVLWKNIGDVLYNLRSDAVSISASYLYSNYTDRNLSYDLTSGEYLFSLDDLARTQSFYGSTHYWGSSWSFDMIWAIRGAQNNSLPIVRQTNDIANADNDQEYSLIVDENGNSMLQGEGTTQNPYKIYTAGDLGWLSYSYSSKTENFSLGEMGGTEQFSSYYDQLNGKYFALQNSIDLSGKSWKPIGDISTPFTGVFDGNRYSIFGLTCSLQEQYDFHGLFGVTENAVIKNLELNESKYISAGTGKDDGGEVVYPEGTYGTFVGLAKKNLYIINSSARDNQDENGNMIANIGFLDANAKFTMIYGVLNAQAVSYELNLQKFLFEGIKIKTDDGIKTLVDDAGKVDTDHLLASDNIQWGYEVSVDGMGGSFYSKDRELYLGEYQLLIDNHGALVEVKDSEGNILDNTFGQTALPGLSIQRGESDYVVQKGFKLLGYKYKKDASTWAGQVDDGTGLCALTNGVIDTSKAPIMGLQAEYQTKGYSSDGTVDKSTAVQVKVVYNAVELETFDTKMAQYSDLPWKVDYDGSVTGVEGAVYCVYYFEYDAYLAEDTNFFVTPSYNNATLRDGNFEVENVYFDADFSNVILENFNNEIDTTGKIDASDTLVNREFVLFADWKGLEDEKFQIKIKFSSDETIDEGKLDFEKAVKLVEFINSSTGRVVQSAQTLEKGADGQYYVLFEYDTTYSVDTLKNIKLRVTLNNGYAFTTTVNFENNDNESDSDNSNKNYQTNYVYDTNFGLLSRNVESIARSQNEVTNFDQYRRDFIFENMLGDYQINVEIQREKQTLNVTVGYDVYFGVAPEAGEYTNLYLYDGNQFSLLNAYLSYTNEDGTELKPFVGYDFINNKLMSSYGAYDNIELSANAISQNNEIVFKYEYTGTVTAKYFVYQLTLGNQSEVTGFEIFQVDYDEAGKTYTNPSHVVSISSEAENQFVITYFTDSTFNFVFSTENQEIVFETLSPEDKYMDTDKEIEEVLNTLTGGKDNYVLNKLCLVGEDNKVTKATIEFTEIGKLYNALSKKEVPLIEAITTYTTAMFEFVAVDKDGNVLDVNAPNVADQSVIVNIAENSLIFDIVSTDFYGFDGHESNGFAEVKLFNNQNYNIQIVAESSTTATANFVDLFNVNNNTYITGSKVCNFYKKGETQEVVSGTQTQYETFSQDTYRITLNFYGQDSSSGLQAGRYTVNFVCVDVNYSIKYAPKFVTQEINSDAEIGSYIKNADDADESNLDDVNLEILVNGNKYDSQTQSVLYGDTVSLSTSLGANQGYEFYKWIVVQHTQDENGNLIDVYKSIEGMQIEELYSILNNQEDVIYGDATISLCGDRRFEVEIYPIYKRKKAEVKLASYFYVYDQNGTGYNSIKFDDLGISLLSSTSDYVNEFEYDYTATTAEDSKWSNVYLSKNNTGKANGYYFVGVQIFYEDVQLNQNNEIIVEGWNQFNASDDSTWAKDDLSDDAIDLTGIVHSFFENGIQVNGQPVYANSMGKILIVPILKQKTANIYFHSGTGNQTNIYGDTFNGEVKNEAGDVESDTILLKKSVMFSQDVYIYFSDYFYDVTGLTSDEVENLTSSDLKLAMINSTFSERTGYSKPATPNPTWGYVYGTTGGLISGSILTSTITLGDSYFDYDDEIERDIHFYRLWRANEYTIIFDANGGTTSAENNLGVVYDQLYSATDNAKTISNRTTKIGYRLTGWALQADGTDKILNIDGTLTSSTSIYNKQYIEDQNGSREERRYKVAKNTTLYAIWEALPYKIKLDFNSANAVSINGSSVTESGSLLADIYYDQMLAQMTYQGEQITSISAERAGFKFAGLYVISGTNRLRVYDASAISPEENVFNSIRFDNNLLGTNLIASEYQLTMYIVWEADNQYFDLSLKKYTYDGIVYDGQVHTFYLASMFDAQNIDKLKGFDIEIEANKIYFSILQDTNSSLSISFVSEMADVSTRDMSFAVKEAGQYVLTLTLEVVDNASVANLGKIASKTLTFDLMVHNANLNVSLGTFITEQAKLLNLKRIIKPFVADDSAQPKSLWSAVTLSEFVENYKTLDATLVNATDNEVYEYLMIKYYQMMHTNDQTYTTYKNWVYDLADSDEDFVGFKTANADLCSEIVVQTYFFDYYDISNETISADWSQYYSISGVLQLDLDVTTDVFVSKVVAYASSVYLTAKDNATIRVYVDGTDVKNYNLRLDENGNRYFVLNNGYVMPQVQAVEIYNDEKSVYYDHNAEAVTVDWHNNLTARQLDATGDMFYEIGTNLYLSATIYTTSIGDSEIQTDFAYTNLENYLYFDDVRVMLAQMSSGTTTYREVTAYFKLTMPETEVFSILSTKGLVKINLDAKYFTFGTSGYFTQDVSQLSELLQITKIEYKDQNAELYNQNGLAEGAYYSETSGARVAEILTNNQNSISIILTKLATKIEVTLDSKYLNEYIMFNSWTNSASTEPLNLEILDASTTITFDFDFSEDESVAVTTSTGQTLTSSGDSLFEIGYFANYTDLIKVQYDLNFPAGMVDTKEISTTAVLKLNSSTVEDLRLPNVDGFERILVEAQTDSGRVEYSKLFQDENGNAQTYQGVDTTSRQARHNVLKLIVTWGIEEISYTRVISETYETQVLNFTGLKVGDVAKIYNISEYCNTSYLWEVEEVDGSWSTVSTKASMSLPNNGSVEESGNYRLTVTATALESLINYGTFGSDANSNASKSITINFALSFVKFKIVGLTLPENPTAIYDGFTHGAGWLVTLQVKVFDLETGTYSENVISQNYSFTTSGSFYFRATINSVETTQFINAGKYLIEACFNEDVYDLSDFSGERTFVFEILPAEVDLSSKRIALSKKFNETETSLETQIYAINQTITLKLERESGENVGLYELYLAGTTQTPSTNINYYMGDVLLFEDGTLTNEGAITSIGSFEIKQSGMLYLSYEITPTLPSVFEVDYDEDGFTATLTDDLSLQIYNGDTLVKEARLKLYDNTQNQYVEKTAILDLLKSAVDGTTIKFVSGESLVVAIDSGIYRYQVLRSTAIMQYYSAIEFESDFMFKINKLQIDVSKFNFTKVYDGEDLQYFDQNANLIEDLSTFSGVYVEAKYGYVHVSESIKVDLLLKEQDYDGNISNFELSSSSASGKITKRTATMTITLTQESYVYGEVMVYDLESVINKPYQVADQSGKDISELLVNGYYSISWSIVANANDKGYAYVGSYALLANATFQDFDMTFILPTITIEKLTYNYVIQEGFITLEAGKDIVEASYQKEIVISQTGDVIALEFKVNGQTAGNPASTGKYNLYLETSLFRNGSLEIVINTENNGFVVLMSTQTLFVRINEADSSGVVWSKTYDKCTYGLIADKDSKTLVISSEEDVTTATLSIFTKDENGNEIASTEDFSSLEIKMGGNLSSVSEVGKYKLYIDATNVNFISVAFDKEYYIEITTIKVDVRSVVLTKEYDGDKNLIFEDFDGKLSGDTVSLLARFDDANVGTNKSGNLYLSGTGRTNYELSSSTFTNGTITRANAVVRLTKQDYVYGEFNRFDTLQYSITTTKGDFVMPNQYTIAFDIEDAQYSSRNYLYADTYAVSLASASSDNYQISFEDTTITVTAYEWDLTLFTSGEVKVEFGTDASRYTTFIYSSMSPLYEDVAMTLTRASGTAIGYYKVTDATTENPNYRLSVVDASESGFFRIVKANDFVYFLMSEEAEITSPIGTTAMIFDVEYDGFVYDTASIIFSGGQYFIRISNSANANAKHDVVINPYKYDSDNQIYTKIEDEISDLQAKLSILNASNAKDVNDVDEPYRIQASGTASSNYQVRLGRAGELYSYYFNITPRKLYFKEGALTKTFDNKDATFVYEDANEMLTKIVEGDNLGLTVHFKQGGSVARYVGENLPVSAILSGETANNYEVVTQTEGGVDVTGSITHAELIVYGNSQIYIYGQMLYDGEQFNHAFDFYYETEVDMTGYNSSRLIFDYELSFDVDTNISTSGALNVGQYNLKLTFGSADFRISKFVMDGVEYEYDDLLDNGTLSIMPVTITVGAKTLTLKQKEGGKTLSEIFTKSYDRNRSVKITDNGGELLFGFEGLLAGDLVGVGTANYASENVGDSIQIDFVLNGTDSQNYTLEPWLFGVISPIYVNLQFDYSDGAVSNVVANGLKEISRLAFPFMSTSYLTANSADADTASVKNFPNAPTKTGSSFSYWTMKFSAISNGSEKHTLLETLVSTYGLTRSYDSYNFEVIIDNGEKSVKFLDELIGNATYRDLGYYFEDNSNPTIKLYSNWEGNKYTIVVRQTDANAKPANLGKISVGGTQISTPYSTSVDYNSSLVLSYVANEHCYLDAIYVNGNYFKNGDDVNIVWNATAKTLQFSNIAKGYEIDFRFAIQTVNVIVDLSAQSSVVVKAGSDFADADGDKKYEWTTDYLTLQTTYLTKIADDLSKIGFTLSQLNTIEVAQLASTTIASQVAPSQEKVVSVTFIPAFEANGIVITLDYRHDDKTKEIVVVFNQKYVEDDEWDANPTRIGYTFAGWWTKDGTTSDAEGNADFGSQITEDSIVENSEVHTIFAQWTINKHSAQFVVTNAQIETDDNSNITFRQNENIYHATDIDFGTVVTFKVVPDAGWQVDTDWGDNRFVVTQNNDDQNSVTVTFEMPDEDISAFEIPVSGAKNKLMILGDNFTVDAWLGDDEIENSQNSFEITTGQVVKVKATANLGWTFGSDENATEYIVLSDENVAIENQTFADGVLTFELVGITKSLSATIATHELTNILTVTFDNVEAFDSIEVDGVTYTVSEAKTFEVKTNQIFEFYAMFKHGYDLNKDDTTSEQYQIEARKITDEDDAYYGSWLLTVDGILTDGTISLASQRAKFTLKVEVVAFDEYKNEVLDSANKAYVKLGDELLESVDVDYKTNVTLVQTPAELYSFVGWSTDRLTTFSMNPTIDFTIEGNQTIYAFFSTLKFTIDLRAYNYYTLGIENGLKTETEVYNLISARFRDGATYQQLDRFEIFYGADKDIVFEVPDGYSYYGYGYYRDDNPNNEFIYLNKDATTNRSINANISSFSLDDDQLHFTFYFVVNAYTVRLMVDTKIDIDGVYEDNANVGTITLQAQDGTSVNDYGYVTGTRTRYSNDSLSNITLLSDKRFTVETYSGEDVYIKAEIKKEGYTFNGIVCDNSRVFVTKVSQTSNEAVYKLSNLIGLANINVDVLFKPQVNVVEFSFENNGSVAEAGAFVVNTTENNARKVWTSGREYSSLQVSAYTDSAFEVTAYIRVGYYLNPENLVITDSSNLIVEGSVDYQTMSIEKTGYVAKVTFKVENYLGSNLIKIEVYSSTYTILLKEDENTLVKIKNVNFDSRIDLSERNTENITIVDSRISFLGGLLRVVMNKENYNFEGYFTHQNGAGVRYINSEGDVINYWKESGYELNQMTGKYQLQDNVYVDSETNELVIMLYVYWSYLKTRINFEFVPNVTTAYTAEDMVSGIDWSNSWFYATSPNYIEVSFNTDIRITAPEIEGYEFFKFVISQKNADGTWLSDVVAYTNEIPWSTNDYDRIVECRIKIVYYAQIDVTIFGGEGTFTVTQDYTEVQAKAMLEKGYVDTTKTCTIEAVAGTGYEFVRWIIYSNGSYSYSPKIENLIITKKTSFMMTLRGMVVTLSFAEYDATFGQITNIIAKSKDNSSSTHTLGTFATEEFVKTLTRVDVKVGDVITFVMKINYGFAVVWNRNDIIFAEYSGDNTYRFTMTILSEDAGKTIVINPQFKDEILSIYIQSKFIDGDVNEDAIDCNDVGKAGYVEFNGKNTVFFTAVHGNDIKAQVVVNERYQIKTITIKNYANSFTEMDEFFTADKQIVLTNAYMQECNIVGNVQIVIEFERLMWQNYEVAEFFEGDGTSKDPYKIKTVEDLSLMMKLINSGEKNSDGQMYADCHYVLENDMELTEKFWTPIGTVENAFNGTFNFKDHKISGIHLAYVFEPIKYGGLFGVVGDDARFISTNPTAWYIYLIIALVAMLLILLVVMIVVSRKRKKRRETLANK